MGVVFGTVLAVCRHTTVLAVVTRLSSLPSVVTRLSLPSCSCLRRHVDSAACMNVALLVVYEWVLLSCVFCELLRSRRVIPVCTCPASHRLLWSICVHRPMHVFVSCYVFLVMFCSRVWCTLYLCQAGPVCLFVCLSVWLSVRRIIQKSVDQFLCNIWEGVGLWSITKNESTVVVIWTWIQQFVSCEIVICPHYSL